MESSASSMAASKPLSVHHKRLLTQIYIQLYIRLYIRTQLGLSSLLLGRVCVCLEVCLYEEDINCEVRQDTSVVFRVASSYVAGSRVHVH